jgi:hypothetical protein
LTVRGWRQKCLDAEIAQENKILNLVVSKRGQMIILSMIAAVVIIYAVQNRKELRILEN